LRSEKLIREAGDSSRTQRERPPFEAATKQRLVKTEKTLCVLTLRSVCPVSPATNPNPVCIIRMSGRGAQHVPPSVSEGASSPAPVAAADNNDDCHHLCIRTALSSEI
jgi:hypothetical protein